MIRHLSRLLACALTLAVIALTAGAARAATGPTNCLIGAYLVSISQVDTAAGTFRADFWMWSVCPTSKTEPLKTVEFVNGVDTKGDLYSNLQRGQQWWATRKFSGVFRQDFSLSNYPFDRQPLEISIEEGVDDARDLVYTVDGRNSGMDPAVDLPGWRLKNFKVIGGVTTHPTSYGDPSLPGGSSRYASLKMRVGVERAHAENFIKAMFPVYIAALLALISLLVTDGRMSLLGATTFAVVLSFVSVERVVGPHDGLYLVDQIHFIALALILACTAWGVLSMRRLARGHDAHQQRQRDKLAAGVLALVYVVMNLAVVGLAIAAAARS